MSADIKHENEDDLLAVDPLADNETDNTGGPADNSCSMMIVRSGNTLAHDDDAIGRSLDTGDDEYESITEIGAQFKLLF